MKTECVSDCHNITTYWSPNVMEIIIVKKKTLLCVIDSSQHQSWMTVQHIKFGMAFMLTENLVSNTDTSYVEHCCARAFHKSVASSSWLLCSNRPKWWVLYSSHCHLNSGNPFAFRKLESGVWPLWNTTSCVKVMESSSITSSNMLWASSWPLSASEIDTWTLDPCSTGGKLSYDFFILFSYWIRLSLTASCRLVTLLLLPHNGYTLQFLQN